MWLRSRLRRVHWLSKFLGGFGLTLTGTHHKLLGTLGGTMNARSGRREFLFRISGAAGAALVAAHWPAMLAAAEQAHQAVQSKGPAKFQVLTLEQARNVEAIASQIIPTDDLPGAREAGVVFFIDLALKTFAKDSLATYQKGLQDVNQLTSELYPGVKSFADASAEQQEKVLTEFAGEPKTHGRSRRFVPVADDFFQTIWLHTVFGFLVDPDAGGNHDYAGWKAIGRDPAHSFSPPFGFYDKDYPGWQATAVETEKK
jgi:gluconate 2-dehydrogenase gamma chain